MHLLRASAGIEAAWSLLLLFAPSSCSRDGSRTIVIVDVAIDDMRTILAITCTYKYWSITWSLECEGTMVTYARANRCLQHNPATQTTSTCPSPISYLYPMFQVLVICRCWSIHLPRLFYLSQYTHAVYARLKLACHEAFVTRSVAYYCMLDLAMWCECHDNVMKTIAQYARMLFSSSEIARTAIEQSVLASNCSSMTRLRHRLPSASYHMHAEDSLIVIARINTGGDNASGVVLHGRDQS